MKILRIVLLGLIAVSMIGPSFASAQCVYWFCDQPEDMSSATCREVICITGNCGKWATSCQEVCDPVPNGGGCWCNYNFCFDI